MEENMAKVLTGSISTNPIQIQIQIQIQSNLAKLLYFTNPDFPEIARDFPYFSPPFGGPKLVFSVAS